MLKKKIACLLLSTSVLAPAAVTAVEGFDSECVEAATNFVEPSSVLDAKPGECYPLYGERPSYDLKGDVNGDGKVNISDFTLLRRYVSAEDKTKIKINTEGADMNEDGKVNVIDLVLLKRSL